MEERGKMADKKVKVKDGVTVTEEAVFVGDYMFKFEGNVIQKYKKRQDAIHGDVAEYEKKVKEIMIKHYAFYGKFQKENQYVKRGSILKCNGGTKLTKFDLLKDHGVMELGGGPIGICSDCKSNHNIYSFGGCNKPTPSGYPERPLEIPTINSKSPFLMHKCIPLLNGNWNKTNGGKLRIWDEDKKDYCDAITTGDYLTCFYGGIISVIEVPQNKVTETELVTLPQLEAFGFYIGDTEKEKLTNLKEINRVLIKYDINNDLRIAFFMGNAYHESQGGTRTLERYGGNDPVVYFNNKYSNNKQLGNNGGDDGSKFRGAGYLHITGRYNYTEFSKYIGDSEIINKGYVVIGGNYNKPLNKIKSGEKGVIDIGKYAWEVSGWFWEELSGISLNTYADQKDYIKILNKINRKDTSTLGTRNRHVNDFYRILTKKELNLPE